MTDRTLVLYMPAFHAGYDAFLSSTGPGQIVVPSQEALADIALAEIRQMTPERMVQVLGGLGYLASIAGPQELARLDGESVVMADEYVGEELARRYFPTSNVTKIPVFLRWDQQNVKSAYGEAEYDAIVTHDEFDRAIMSRARLEAGRSSDWFRRVGAALVVDGEVRSLKHNERMPSPHEPWAVGDPRAYVEYGSDTHLKTVVHAEEGIIVDAAKNGIATEGAWLYATVFPCPSCAGMIARSGIAKLFFEEGYPALRGDETLKANGVELIKVEG